MNKEKFLNELRCKLKGLSKEDIDGHISFYEEIISDIMEEGKTEEEAISEIGSVDKIVNDIAQDTSLISLVKQKMKPKKNFSGLQIALIIIGFPIWLPLLIVILVLILVALILTWVFLLVAYAIEVSFIVGSIASLILFLVYLLMGDANFILLGGAIALAGLSILLFFGCKGLGKLIVLLNKKTLLGVKTMLIRGGKDNE